MSSRKSVYAAEIARERRAIERERTWERRAARQSKRIERVAFGGAW